MGKRKHKHEKPLSFDPYELGRLLLAMARIERKVEDWQLVKIACAFDICAGYPEV